MNRDFSPDWAGPYQQMVASVLTTITPPHRFFNASYNGVAYNPATAIVRPPCSTAVARWIPTYPSMDGSSVAAGGDATATAGSRNWRAVKVDGYGVQSAPTANLEGAAFSHTTVPGEYCTAANLRAICCRFLTDRVLHRARAVARCNDSRPALDTTANAGTSCIASNIEPAAGVTHLPPYRATADGDHYGRRCGNCYRHYRRRSRSFPRRCDRRHDDCGRDRHRRQDQCLHLGTTGACATVGFSATERRTL